MMTRILLVLALAAGAAQAQNATSPTPQKPAAPAASTPAPALIPAPTPAPVAPTDAVITIHGLCPEGQTPPSGTDTSSCTTVITKQQFDDIINAVAQPGQPVPREIYKNLGQRYADLLTLDDAAIKAGAENDPRFKIQMQLDRMQQLAGRYRYNLTEEYLKVSDDDLNAYYQKQLPSYEEVAFRLLFVPNPNPTPQSKDAKDTGNDQASFDQRAHSEADTMHERALKGDDLEQIEKDAYKDLAITSTPVKPDSATWRLAMFPPPLGQALWALNPGQFSDVESVPGGYAVFKVESKNTHPLSEAKDQITHDIAVQKLQDKMKSVTQAVKVDFNQDYFTAPAPPKAAPVPAPSSSPAPTPKSPK